jgi:hypothetical protein
MSVYNHIYIKEILEKHTSNIIVVSLESKTEGEERDFCFELYTK